MTGFGTPPSEGDARYASGITRTLDVSTTVADSSGKLKEPKNAVPGGNLGDWSGKQVAEAGSSAPNTGDGLDERTVRPQLDVVDRTGTPGNLGEWKAQQDKGRAAYNQEKPKPAAQIEAELRLAAELREATSRSHKERLEKSGYKPRTHQEIAAFNEEERKDLHNHGQGLER